MFAVYKRELKVYFYSPTAYVVIALFMFLSSMYFSNLLYNGITDFNSILDSMGFIFVFLAPILTMRSIAEDRKSGIEVLLITSPQSITNIVLGKFFSLLTILLLITILTMIYPIILLIYGNPFITQIVGGYIGFIFLGATFIAIGIFASALTENQIIAAATGFVMLLTMWITDTLANYTGGIFKEILNWISMISRFRDFNIGILNLSNIVYYFSFIIVFLFLTISIMERKRWKQG